jgi:hypothetical protein
MNYTINAYKLPNEHNFSKNPIPFGINIFPWADGNITSRHKIIVSLLFAYDLDNPTYEEIWSGTMSPDKNGYAIIDIANILDAKLEYFTPNVNVLKMYECKKQSGMFKIRYYLAGNNDILSDEDTTDEFYIYKGGVSKDDFDNNASYLNTNIVTNRTPMHFYQANERVRADEPKWMYFIYTVAAAVQATEVSFHINYWQTNAVTNDITTSVQTILLVPKQVYCVPVGFTQSGLAAAATDADLVYKYTIEINDQSPEILASALFFIDRRPFYDVQYLLYRNSLGALETQAMLGEKEFGMAINGERTETLSLVELMGDVTLQTETFDARNFYNNMVKANTGWVALAVLMRLKDLLLNRQVFLPYGNRLKPLYVNTRGPVLFKTKDNLYSMAINYSNAYEDENFAPEGLIEFADICPAVEFIWAWQELGGFISVMWKLPAGYERIEFYYTVDLTGATVYEVQFNGNTGQAQIDINSASNTLIESFEVTLKARCVCNDEISPYSYGAYTSDLIINGDSIIPPIANNDEADEGERSLVARILKIAGADANFLNNDVARNGGFIGFEGVYDVSGVTPIATSQNGANVQQSGNGGILYLPTPASIGLLDEDYVYYKCNEYITSYGYMLSAVGRIKVPLKDSIPTVYVKMEMPDIKVTTHKKNGTNHYEKKGPLYFKFYKDAACTIPIDVTTYGLVIAYDVYKQHYQYPPAYGTLIYGWTYDQTISVTVTGYSFLANPDFWLSNWIPGSPASMFFRKIESSPSSTVGNVVFVGW